MPAQWPFGSRYCGGTISSIIADLIGWVTPACTASSMRPMSTVSSTSAGLLAPSALMRCSRPELAEIDVDLDAGVLGEGVEQRLHQLGLAIGVDVDLSVRRNVRPAAARGGRGRVAAARKRIMRQAPEQSTNAAQ